MLGDWSEAEEACADYLRAAGFPDVSVTGAGADRGIDLFGDRVLAQVKFWGQKVSRQHLQQLVGAAHGRRVELVFFSASGFSRPAFEYAQTTGMKLVAFNEREDFVCLLGGLPSLNTDPTRKAVTSKSLNTRESGPRNTLGTLWAKYREVSTGSFLVDLMVLGFIIFTGWVAGIFVWAILTSG